MFLSTLLPASAEIVIRGGPGHEAWGHPLEKTAQYNHVTEGRKRPPLCPWRIEVGDPAGEARTLFLHVFEIAGESVRQPTGLKFLPPAGVAIGDLWQVRFEPSGPMGGKVGDKSLSTAVKSDGQYTRADRAGGN